MTDELRPRPGQDTHEAPGGGVFTEGFGHAAWERVDGTQLGVHVIDPDGHRMGPATCIRTNFGIETGGWRPVDGYKHILVGELDHYSFYDPFLGGAEADFNLDIYPDQAFRPILETVADMMSEDERHELITRRRGLGHTVECEITPDESYYNNFWFPTREHAQTQLLGTHLGVYGPWVRDLAHGGRPEIHPCEVIWWRQNDLSTLAHERANFVRWTIIVLQDDSNRFDRASDYEGELLRPWSQSPRTAHITMALGALRGEHIIYNISMRDGRRIYDWPEEDTRTLTRDFDDRPAISVHKRTSRPAEIRMRLGGLVPDPAGTDELRCFLDFWIRVGEGDRGQEGFAELTVEAWGPAPEPVGPNGPTGGRPHRPHPTPGGDHRPPGTQEP
jgi:hypothetical protein